MSSNSTLSPQKHHLDRSAHLAGGPTEHLARARRLALSLATQAEAASREATGWTQIIQTRLSGGHIGLAGRDVLCRCTTELERSAAEISTAAVALLDLIEATEGEIHT